MVAIVLVALHAEKVEPFPVCRKRPSGGREPSGKLLVEVHGHIGGSETDRGKLFPSALRLQWWSTCILVRGRETGRWLVTFKGVGIA